MSAHQSKKPICLGATKQHQQLLSGCNLPKDRSVLIWRIRVSEPQSVFKTIIRFFISPQTVSKRIIYQAITENVKCTSYQTAINGPSLVCVLACSAEIAWQVSCTDSEGCELPCSPVPLQTQQRVAMWQAQITKTNISFIPDAKCCFCSQDPPRASLLICLHIPLPDQHTHQPRKHLYKQLSLGLVICVW